MFTLKNHRGVAPTKFLIKGPDAQAAYVGCQHRHVCFGCWEGFSICPDARILFHDQNFGDPAGLGAEIFCGSETRSFRAKRWELWETA